MWIERMCFLLVVKEAWETLRSYVVDLYVLDQGREMGFEEWRYGIRNLFLEMLCLRFTLRVRT